MSTKYPIHTKPLTRSTTRSVSRLAVGAAVHGGVPGQTQYHPYAKDYFGRVESLGGGFANHYYAESETKSALSDFFRRLDDTGVWPAIAELYLMAGCDFAGLPAKAKYVIVPNITWYSLVTGDYTPAGGATPGINFGNPRWGDSLLSSYILGDQPGIGFLASEPGLGCPIGDGTTGGDMRYQINVTGSDVRVRLRSAEQVFMPHSGPIELCTVTRTSSSEVEFVLAGESPVPAASPVGVSTDTTDLVIGRRRSDAAPTWYTGTLVAVWATSGATPQQIIDLHAAVTSLRGSLS